MSKKYMRFALGDNVKLKRNIGAVSAGTTGVVVRADDDGQLWVKVKIDEECNEIYVMTIDWLGNLEKIEDTEMETKK